ncbi:MAG: hypothetical protein LBN40_01985 [Oscillospiraceae bacterium]|jgi:hypothetical protein|nr:hypothetical protein [Oscillospiraceae bacterium]
MSKNIDKSNLMKLIGAESPDVPSLGGRRSEPRSPGKPPASIEPTEEAEPLKKKRPPKTAVGGKGLADFVAAPSANPVMRNIKPTEPRVEAKVEQPLAYHIPNGLSRQILDLPFYLFNEQFGEIAAKYAVCTCDICCERFAKAAAEQSEHKVVFIGSDDDLNEADAAIAEARPDMIRILTKLCIAAKFKPFHERNT